MLVTSVQRPGLRSIRHFDMPAFRIFRLRTILLECRFLWNPDARRLRTLRYLSYNK